MNRLRSWLKEGFSFLSQDSLRHLVWLGLSLLFLAVFLKVTWELREHAGLEALDRQILVFISRFRVNALNGAAVDLTALGSATVVALVTTVGVLVLWLARDLRGAAYLALGSIGAGLATFSMKFLFSRERPTVVPRLVEVSGFSYPSGHSLAATSLYLLLMFLAWRRFAAWHARALLLGCALALIGGVCFSRLYLGVHYPSDVLGGAGLGAAWTCLLTAYFSRPQRRRA